MGYKVMKDNLKLFGQVYNFGDRFERFDDLPVGNQRALINLGWIMKTDGTPKKKKVRQTKKQEEKTKQS